MDCKFKPLRKITQEEIEIGHPILIKKIPNQDYSSISEIIAPTLFGGEDTYISDGSAGIEKRKKLEGIRIFNNMSNGKMNLKNCPIKSGFKDETRGLFLPFKSDSKYEYLSLL